MSELGKIYEISLKDYRAEARKRLKDNERCYDSLNYKEADYAKSIKALQDLHRQVFEIYQNAPDTI